MPVYVVSRLISALNDRGLALKGAKVLVLGIAYKPNIDDIRESPAAEIIELLADGGAEVSYHDPHVPRFPAMRRHHIDLGSVPLTAAMVRDRDAVLIVTDHDAVDYTLVGAHAKLVIDSRNAMARAKHPTATIIKA